MIPGLRGADHVGISVPDIDQAARFFVDVIGAEAFYSLGPYRDRPDEFNPEHFGVHPEAEVNEIRLLRLGNLNIELIEWTSEDQNRSMPRLNDLGSCELCLYVDDIDKAIQYLRARGIQVLGEKLSLEGPEAGRDACFVYFRSPWGAMMELISYPHGRAYEAEVNMALWNPGKPKLDHLPSD